MEGNELPNGWPLGLGNMNSRFRVVGTRTPEAAASGLHRRRSSSFSSFSSSNLETESTASFFPDQSVSLGRLIGMQPANKGRLHRENEGNVPDETSHHVSIRVPENRTHTHNSHHGICAPLLHHVILRIGRCRTTSTQ